MSCTVGVPTVGFSSKATNDYLQTKRVKEVQELRPIFVGYVVVGVSQGAYGGGNAGPSR
jgi:hypothetical protein